MSESTSSTTQQPEKIDIMSFVEDILHRLKRFWWVIVILTLACGALFYYRTRVSYTPSFVSDATVAVELVNAGNYSNENTAELMSTIFPYVLSSGTLSDMIKSDLGLTYVPGNISASNIKGTNLLTITVRGNNAQRVYAVLQSVLRNYPTVAQFAVGQTKFSVIYDGGLPTDTGKETVVRGSLRNGLIAGFLLGVVLLVIYTLVTRTVRTENDLTKLVNLPLLGSLPLNKKKRNKKKNQEINMLSDSAKSEYIESMRLIRARLERRMGDAKVIMVTSSIPSEGKSTVAANLAISLMRKGRKVVLVDCDLRNPSLKKIFDFGENMPGLQSVLKGEADLKSTLVPITDKDGSTMTLLPGNDHGMRNAELLGSSKMEEVIEQLKAEYDLIILDTPPSGMLMDASFVTRFCDGAVYVVLSDFAKRSIILRGVEELAGTDVPIFGCVLNGGSAGNHGHYYGYYGYYGYRSSNKYGYGSSSSEGYLKAGESTEKA